MHVVDVGAAKDAFTAAASTLDRGETETNNEDGGTDNQALILVFFVSHILLLHINCLIYNFYLCSPPF